MPTPHKTLLLVEDHETVAAMEMRHLKTIGYDVIHVPSGDAAINEIFSGGTAIDLILMDVNLGPAMSGITAAQILRSAFDIPVIFLSSHMDRDVIELAEKISPYGYVLKSSGIFALSTTIKMAFRLHDAIAQVKKQKIGKSCGAEQPESRWEYSPLAMMQWNTAFTITRWSDEAERLFGFKKDDAVGNTILGLNIICAQDLPAASRNLATLAAGEIRVSIFSTLSQTKFGEKFPCKWYNSVRRDEKGALVSVMSLIQDVSRQMTDLSSYTQQ